MSSAVRPNLCGFTQSELNDLKPDFELPTPTKDHEWVPANALASESAWALKGDYSADTYTPGLVYDYEDDMIVEKRKDGRIATWFQRLKKEHNDEEECGEHKEENKPRVAEKWWTPLKGITPNLELPKPKADYEWVAYASTVNDREYAFNASQSFEPGLVYSGADMIFEKRQDDHVVITWVQCKKPPPSEPTSSYLSNCVLC